MSVTQGVDLKLNPMVEMGRPGRLLVLGAAALILTGVGVGGILNETDQFPGIFFALLLYVSALMLPLFIVKENLGWFHPLVYTGCFGLLQVIRKSGSYIGGMTEHVGVPGFGVAELNALIWQLLLLQCLAQIMFCLGFLLGPAKSPSKVWSGSRIDPSARLIGLMTAVVAFYVAFVRNKGGLEEHMLDLGKGRVRQIEETQLFGVSVLITNLASFALSALVAYARNSLHYLYIAICAPVVLFMNYTIAGSRSSLVYTVILVLIARSLAAKRIYWTLYLTGAFAAILAIGALGQVRRGSWAGSSGLQESVVTLSTTDSFLGGIEELQERGSELHPVYAILARVPQEVPYLLGKSYLTVLAAPIPRALWMDKPRSTGALVGPTFFDSNAGMPPGAIGEALWNFGVPGVAVAFLVFGFCYRLIYEWFRVNRQSSVAVVIYALTLLYLQPDVLAFIAWLQMCVLGYGFCRILGIVHTVPRLAFGEPTVARNPFGMSSRRA